MNKRHGIEYKLQNVQEQVVKAERRTSWEELVSVFLSCNRLLMWIAMREIWIWKR